MIQPNALIALQTARGKKRFEKIGSPSDKLPQDPARFWICSIDSKSRNSCLAFSIPKRKVVFPKARDSDAGTNHERIQPAVLYLRALPCP
jgi:hypothetical protein